MKEPTESTFFALATAVGIGTVIVLNAWIAWIPTSSPNSGSIVLNPRELGFSGLLIGLGKLLVGLMALIVTHELIHLVAHPKLGFSRKSILGVLPNRGAFYAFYDGEMTRNRFILMVLAPFVCITLVPLAAFTFIAPPPVFFALVILANGLFSGGDLVTTGLVMMRLPRRSLIRHQSWDAYWKPIEQITA